jgi:hypothetical protein
VQIPEKAAEPSIIGPGPEEKISATPPEKRWGISRAHAYRLMSAYQIAEMSPAGDKPKSEREANKRKDNPKVSPAGDTPEPTPKPKLETPLTAVDDVKDLDVNEEFKRFEKMLTLWGSKFAKQDYVWLLQRVNQHVGGCLSVDMEVAA